MEACRTCLKIIDLKKCVHHEIESPNAKLTATSNRYKILTIIPEMALNISSKSILCDPCFTNIQSIYNFRSKCMQTESMIMRYINTRPYIDLKQIDLKEVAYLNNMGYVPKPITNVESNTEISNSSVVSLENEAVPVIKKEPSAPEYEIENTTSQSPVVCVESEDITVKQEITDLTIPDSASQNTNSASNTLLLQALNNVNTQASNSSNVNFDLVDDVVNSSTAKDSQAFSCDDNVQTSLEKLDNAFDINFSLEKFDKAFTGNSNSDMNINVDEFNIDSNNSNMNVNLEKQHISDTNMNPSYMNQSYKDPSDMNVSYINTSDMNPSYMNTSDMNQSYANTSDVNCSYMNANETFGDNFTVDLDSDAHDATELLLDQSNENIVVEPDILKPQSAETNVNTFEELPLPPGVQCPTCLKVFATKSRFECHYRTHTRETPYKCTLCPKAYTDASTLRKHLIIHSGIKQFACELCESKFYDRGNLNKHMIVHTNVKPFKCEVCEKDFSRKEHLKKHKLTHTGEKHYECDICHKKYARKSVLMIHMSLHTGQRDYSCEYCNKGFYDSSTLRKHRLSHTGEKPYQCKVCNRKYAQKTHLTIHERQHNGERPFVCEICTKSFTASQRLKNHMRSHSGEKPYECPVCKKRFSTLSNCFTHKKIHTGVKAFQCGHCHKNFTHKNDLKKHIMVHTEEKPFLCHICNRAFNRKIRARQHIQKMHKEVDISTVVIQRYKTTTTVEEPVDVKNINTEIIIKTENEIPIDDVRNVYEDVKNVLEDVKNVLETTRFT